MTVDQAVREWVRPGRTVYLGNFGAQLFAVGAALIRARCRDLHVVAGSGGLLLDQLIGAGVASRVTFAHCWNPIGPAPAWNLRRSAESGAPAVEITEFSLGVLTAAFRAAAEGVPFAPVVTSEQTGYVTWARGAISRVSSPYGEAFVVRALRPDVAFVHADMVDRRGNALLLAPGGEHLFAAQAATTTIVVTEEIVDHLPRPANLAGIHVDEVVVHPGAVHPDGAVGRYPRDPAAYRNYASRSSTPDGFTNWLHALTAADPQATGGGW
ncbi:CoA transferase subunit A [Cryptosporangium sp. NPDC048952]|uniref:CoA transferase subunit A n=1 Tax=Cryptosporangium sp. NPDC048952 TaxID=3363961 RepID=UPI0037127551